MQIESISALYRRLPQVRELSEWLENKRTKSISLSGLLASAAPVMFSGLNSERPFLFILNDDEEAGYFYNDMVHILGAEKTLFFPSPYRYTKKYSQQDAANEILRTEVMAKLAGGAESPYIVTYPEALTELVESIETLKKNTLQVRVGETIDTAFIKETLLEYGFCQVDYVYEPGQFAVRGSIVDVFSYSCEYPYRIDFFSDDVDSIRTFDVQTQLSIEKKEYASLTPAPAAEGKGDMVSFFEILPKETIVVLKDLTFVSDKLEEANPQPNTEGKGVLVGQLTSFKRIELKASAGRKSASSENNSGKAISFSIAPQPLFHKNFDMLVASMENFLAEGYRLFILADSPKQHQRLKEIFESKSQYITFTQVDKTIHEGYSDADLKICFFTDHQIFDRFHKFNLRSERARSGKIALSLKELQQFEYGDLIVHIDHGIGRFEGLVKLEQGGKCQEMIKIAYLNDDTIYVSIHSLHKVAKYKGRDGAENVKLSRLGSGAWENLKERTKKKIKDIARDLILLYANRRKEKGFAFSADNYMQNELEASFLYEDTPDQLKATNDVKADMEKAVPMDRLICGDVGFGKTEVAIRAAFKAACDSKQVAVLVPTTVLAYQHYQTFLARLKDLPVRVEYLSRARSAKKTNEILQELADGKIDIVIGTHKILGKNIKFHDLGLLIIDEEQKFGVAAKEKLRQIRNNVDTITMSATPIPRTLQFSMMGARDLSVIQTPPPNRYPIQTEVHTFDKDLIADAIKYELDRNGQVFFVSNRISSLDELARIIAHRVPEARVVIGHGQMKPEQLEQVVMGFVNYDYDVLLSTTIIENGIDIPNANTIIINNAQNFGLSDLHQMRGRVGRGNKKAFCYLLAPPLSVLPNDARKRLEAIENFSDLGSGIHLAMQDLDIRGAGNLLGSEQSGFIADLGYETYQKILTEAVTEIRNEEKLSPDNSTEGQGDIEASLYVSDCTIETDIEICFPESYVPSSSERMLLYRELDGLKDDDEIERFRKKLIDRFGPVPPVGEDLMKVVVLRRLGKRNGIERFVLKQDKMNMYLVSNNDSPYYDGPEFGRILSFVMANPKRCNIKEVKEKRYVAINSVPSVQFAIDIMNKIESHGEV